MSFSRLTDVRKRRVITPIPLSVLPPQSRFRPTAGVSRLISSVWDFRTLVGNCARVHHVIHGFCLRHSQATRRQTIFKAMFWSSEPAHGPAKHQKTLSRKESRNWRLRLGKAKDLGSSELFQRRIAKLIS